MFNVCILDATLNDYILLHGHWSYLCSLKFKDFLSSFHHLLIFEFFMGTVAITTNDLQNNYIIFLYRW